MRKAQISVEFSILFTVAVFIIVFILSFIPGWLDKVNSPADEANNIVRDIKERVIIASLSPVDFESKIELPANIGYTNLQIEVYAGDDLVMVKQQDTGKILARAFLPKLDYAGGEGDMQMTLTSGNIMVIRKVGETLSVSQEAP